MNETDSVVTLFEEIRRSSDFDFKPFKSTGIGNGEIMSHEEHLPMYIKFNGTELSEEACSHLMIKNVGLKDGVLIECFEKTFASDANRPILFRIQGFEPPVNPYRNPLEGYQVNGQQQQQQQPRSANQAPPPKEPEKTKT
ncbi:hypothetical protein FSP39_000038 [Pinctada imbricata]|uniref:Uncharacterized protein n=1 Tax=Pinctada imbricata TaxID=66713 RepID=A0AA89BWK4_PINIB|nr:hypothetical protein FSP39_000038 [Pinctada imbricata]